MHRPIRSGDSNLAHIFTHSRRHWLDPGTAHQFFLLPLRPQLHPEAGAPAGELQEIAAMVAFLATEASYVTGQVSFVNGGGPGG